MGVHANMKTNQSRIHESNQMSQHQPPDDEDEDDGLTRRFKALFNKDPVSQVNTSTEKPWTSKETEEDYNIDEEEVFIPHFERGLWLTVSWEN